MSDHNKERERKLCLSVLSAYQCDLQPTQTRVEPHDSGDPHLFTTVHFGLNSGGVPDRESENTIRQDRNRWLHRALKMCLHTPNAAQPHSLLG